MRRYLGLTVWMAGLAFGQGERANITGTVTDASQAVVPGAAVAVRHTGTNVVNRAESNSAGIYYIPSLPPGEYELTVEHTGFRPSQVSAIPLSTGLTATINVVLEAGTVAEAVEVRSSAVLLETQTSGLNKTSAGPSGAPPTPASREASPCRIRF